MPAGKPTPKKKVALKSSKHPRRSNGRCGETRRPIERIFTIHEAIQRGRFPNCRQLAEEIEVTQKTIQRDITFMQNDLGLPLSYNGTKHGYFYERPVHEFPMMRYTVEDVVALFLARKAVEPLQGSPLEATLRDSFKRLSGALQGEVSFRWTDLNEAFSVKDSGVVPADVRLFEKVSRAVLECRELRFDYRKIDSEAWESRKIRPFHLADFDGGWYVIGYDETRKARRTFALQRIKAARVMKTTFLRPADFKLADHLGGSFGVWDSPEKKGKNHRVRLHFTGWAARMVSERRWHPSQESSWLGEKEEKLELIMDLSSFEEITRWILSWGPQVEVVEPEILRASVRDALEETLTAYS
ncbi:MAG: WYL domain-containing protein [Verrucomicrobiales bacterium]|nr:WYL domain-containing protein [Verrucomicrobiales bacterium]